MKVQHEHEYEPAVGLPEKLPVDEFILWQVSPNWWQLAVHAFHIKKVAVYFVVILFLKFIFLLADDHLLLSSFALSVVLSAVALCLLALLALFSARASLYTLTNRRVVMRIGIALTVTFNLPLSRISSASIDVLNLGYGDIVLTLKGEDRIAWIHLWPHVRPWVLRHPEPMMRCVPGAQAFGELIKQTWNEVNSDVQLKNDLPTIKLNLTSSQNNFQVV